MFCKILALSSFIAVSVTSVAGQFDCNAGCSLDYNINGAPVCGDDSLTYSNACLAFCQGIKKYTSGPCAGEGDRIELIQETEVITRAVMNRFAKERFRFVAKETKFSTEPIVEESATDSDIDLETPSNWNAVRITSEGYKFIAKEGAALQFAASTLPYLGRVEDSQPHLRKTRVLGVLGADTRTVVANTAVFPYRAIAALDYVFPSLCTGTIISRTSALTAGHCVYDKVNKLPRKMSKIAPGRYFDRSQSDNTTEPFGTWDVDFMTTLQGYIDEGARTFDIAVVTFKSRPGTDPKCLNNPPVFPGDVVGYLGIDRVQGTNTTVNDARLSTMTITGYPYDFEDGQMVTSGLCAAPPQSNGPNYILHQCDTESGMSGAALLTSKNVVLGVHNVEVAGVGFNGAIVLSARSFDPVYEWAGLGNQIAFNCQTQSKVCPCSQFTRFRRVRCWILNYEACLASLQNSRQSN